MIKLLVKKMGRLPHFFVMGHRAVVCVVYFFLFYDGFGNRILLFLALVWLIR